MANVNTAALQGKAQAAGLDWSKLGDFIKNMNWLEVIQFVQTIIGIFSSKAPTIKAGQAPAADLPACVCAHQDAIIDLAECCKKQCGG